jgi:hypothetical protein
MVWVNQRCAAAGHGRCEANRLTNDILTLSGKNPNRFHVIGALTGNQAGFHRARQRGL